MSKKKPKKRMAPGLIKGLKEAVEIEKQSLPNPFIGEVVDIFLNTSGVEIIETEQGPMVVNAPLRVSGYLLDQDENNYYLGKTAQSVSIKIPVKNEVFMQIAEEELGTIVPLFPDPSNTELN